MGNACKNKINEFTCRSQCQISKEMQDLKKYFMNLSLEELIKIKKNIETENNDMLKINFSTML